MKKREVMSWQKEEKRSLSKIKYIPCLSRILQDLCLWIKEDRLELGRLDVFVHKGLRAPSSSWRSFCVSWILLLWASCLGCCFISFLRLFFTSSVYAFSWGSCVRTWSVLSLCILHQYISFLWFLQSSLPECIWKRPVAGRLAFKQEVRELDSHREMQPYL